MLALVSVVSRSHSELAVGCGWPRVRVPASHIVWEVVQFLVKSRLVSARSGVKQCWPVNNKQCWPINNKHCVAMTKRPEISSQEPSLQH